MKPEALEVVDTTVVAITSGKQTNKKYMSTHLITWDLLLSTNIHLYELSFSCLFR